MTKPKPKSPKPQPPNDTSYTTAAGGPTAAAKYRGVRMRKWGRWVAEIRAPNSRRRIWLGSYKTAAEAARAYDAALFMLRGTHASLNFPDALPEVPPVVVGDGPSPSAAEIQVAASKHARALATTPT